MNKGNRTGRDKEPCPGFQRRISNFFPESPSEVEAPFSNLFRGLKSIFVVGCSKHPAALPSIVGVLQRLDVQLAHFQHRLGDAVGFHRVRVAHQLFQDRRHNLPRQAVFICIRQDVI